VDKLSKPTQNDLSVDLKTTNTIYASELSTLA